MKNKFRKKWLLQAIAGLVFTGAGLSMAIDAGLCKMQGGHWFWQGTFALVVFNTGLCLSINSVQYKIQSEK